MFNFVNLYVESNVFPSHNRTTASWSPCSSVAKLSKEIADFNKYFSEFHRFRIVHSMGFEHDAQDTNNNWVNMGNFLSKLTVCSVTDILAALELNLQHTESFSFDLELLKSMSESDVQKHISNKNIPGLLDTHSKNDIAQSACVADVRKGKTCNGFHFESIPDFSFAQVPGFLEIKARSSLKKSSTNELTDQFADVSLDQSTDVTSTVENEADADPGTGCGQPSDMKGVSLTLTECALLAQLFQRVVQVVQFRAYLSRFIVLGSTGYWTFVFYLTQDFSNRKEKRELQIFVVEPTTVDHIYSSLRDVVDKEGPQYYLTSHAPLIFNALKLINQEILAPPTANPQLLRVRVHVAVVSNTTVYYVTPCKNGVVCADKKVFAFKVVTDTENFERETDFLDRIAGSWTASSLGPFYYLGRYNHTYCTINFTDDGRQTVQTSASFYTTARTEAVEWLSGDLMPQGEGGVIIMRAAERTGPECNNKESLSLKFCQLFASLRVAHQLGIVHCDLRPSNFVYFREMDNTGYWQVIDYDHAAQIPERETMTSTSMQVDSDQLRCCRTAMLNELGLQEGTITVEVSVETDICMLQKNV